MFPFLQWALCIVRCMQLCVLFRSPRNCHDQDTIFELVYFISTCERYELKWSGSYANFTLPSVTSRDLISIVANKAIYDYQNLFIKFCSYLFQFPYHPSHEGQIVVQVDILPYDVGHNLRCRILEQHLAYLGWAHETSSKRAQQIIRSEIGKRPLRSPPVALR